jgi:hypothetical protein
MMKTIQSVFATAALTCLLSACGGGGGDTAEPSLASRYSAVGSYPITDCVKDNRTGLIWEGKATSGQRYSVNGYTNYDSTTDLQFWTGVGRVAATPSDLEAATNAIGYKQVVNAIGLCGYRDWRLPTVDELKGLIVSGVTPSIDSSWFPNTISAFYWTSSPYVDDVRYAWGVNFFTGTVGFNLRNYTLLVRLVR